MVTLENTVNESERLKSLKRYQILDTPPDGSFDRITVLASSLFKIPIAIISLVDSERIWFKSHHGLTVRQIGRDPGLCASAILSNDLYIIENAKNDPRCMTNPLVAGEFGLQFYAAAPLHTEDNYNLGTLCIIDKNPRVFTKEEKIVLKQLGDIVMDEMNLRLALRETTNKVRNLACDMAEQVNDTIEKIRKGEQNDIITYLKASKNYLQNIQNQLNYV
jgi:GAF domain-containing protein